jgi:hypothetical protein
MTAMEKLHSFLDNSNTILKEKVLELALEMDMDRRYPNIVLLWR